MERPLLDLQPIREFSSDVMRNTEDLWALSGEQITVQVFPFVVLFLCVPQRCCPSVLLTHSLLHTHSHLHSLSHIYVHAFARTRFSLRLLSLDFLLDLSISITQSLSLTHSPINARALSLSLSLSLVFTHTHTYTYTHIHNTHTYTHTHRKPRKLPAAAQGVHTLSAGARESGVCGIRR
jgi:hypothetical protein